MRTPSRDRRHRPREPSPPSSGARNRRRSLSSSPERWVPRDDCSRHRDEYRDEASHDRHHREAEDQRGRTRDRRTHKPRDEPHRCESRPRTPTVTKRGKEHGIGETAGTFLASLGLATILLHRARSKDRKKSSHKKLGGQYEREYTYRARSRSVVRGRERRRRSVSRSRVVQHGDDAPRMSGGEYAYGSGPLRRGGDLEWDWRYERRRSSVRPVVYVEGVPERRWDGGRARKKRVRWAL